MHNNRRGQCTTHRFSYGSRWKEATNNQITVKVGKVAINVIQDSKIVANTAKRLGDERCGGIRYMPIDFIEIFVKMLVVTALLV